MNTPKQVYIVIEQDDKTHVAIVDIYEKYEDAVARLHECRRDPETSGEFTYSLESRDLK